MRVGPVCFMVDVAPVTQTGATAYPVAPWLDPAARDHPLIGRPLIGPIVDRPDRLDFRPDCLAARSGGGSAPLQPRHRPRRAQLWRAGADPPKDGRHSLSHGAAFQAWNAPTGRQGMMTSPLGTPIAPTQFRPGHAMPDDGMPMWTLAGRGKPPRGMPGRRIDSACSPEPRGGPHPASLSCRRPVGLPRGNPGGRTLHDRPADRSSGVYDKAHADRRQPRGRNPRGGAGR